MLFGDVEFGKYDQEDEDVVDRQRQLEQVRRIVFRSCRRLLRDSDPHANGESERDPPCNPEDTFPRRRCHSGSAIGFRSYFRSTLTICFSRARSSSASCALVRRSASDQPPPSALKIAAACRVTSTRLCAS